MFQILLEIVEKINKRKKIVAKIVCGWILSNQCQSLF